MTLGPHPPNSARQQEATEQARLDLIHVLEERLEVAHRRITLLEEMMGWGKRTLIDEIEELRRLLRERQG